MDDELGEDLDPGERLRDDDLRERTPAPGSPEALRRGCRCSVLLNQAPVGGSDNTHFVDPLCPLDHSGGVDPDPPRPP